MHEIVVRDHLLVTAGARAAFMDREGTIDISIESIGEGYLAKFITHLVDRYIEIDADMDFYEYIETNLILAFSKDNHLMKGE